MVDHSSKVFQKARFQQGKFEILPEGSLRCPVCWVIQPAMEFTREHIPPTQVSRLINETPIPGLFTCVRCNNQAGSNGQDDLKSLVEWQLWQTGQFKQFIPGTMDIFGETIRVEMDWWTRSDIQINYIEMANNPNVTDKVMKLLATSSPGTEFKVSVKFHKPKPAAWALIHSAYLYLTQVTEYSYAYARAGAQIRKMLGSNLVEAVENYCLPANEHPNPWTSRVYKTGQA